MRCGLGTSAMQCDLGASSMQCGLGTSAMQGGLGTSAMLCHSNLVGILFVVVDWRFEALLTE